MMALHTAERFIKELRPKTNTTRLRQQVLSSYTLLASKKKPDAEHALQKFVDIASGEVSMQFHVVITRSLIVTERFHSCTTWHGYRSHDLETNS